MAVSKFVNVQDCTILSLSQRHKGIANFFDADELLIRDCTIIIIDNCIKIVPKLSEKIEPPQID